MKTNFIWFVVLAIPIGLAAYVYYKRKQSQQAIADVQAASVAQTEQAIGTMENAAQYDGWSGAGF